MKVWSYTAGVGYTHDPKNDWGDEKDVKEYAATHGFDLLPENHDGEEFVGTEVYYPVNEEDERRLLVLDSYTRCAMFIAMDEPSEIELRAKLAAIVSTQLLTEKLDELLETSRKAFHAMHGHRHDTCCYGCDPTEARARERMRVEHRARERERREEKAR